LGAIDNHEINFKHTDFHLSYLPLAHIFERVVIYSCLVRGSTMGMYNGDTLKLKQDLLDFRPTVFASVPRLYNRFYDLMNASFKDLTGVKKSLVDRGLEVKMNNLIKNA